MTKDEELAMDLALEALEYIYEGANNQGPHTGISWRCVAVKAEPAIKAIKQARALDKKAENARELGLDYEPADGTQVSKVWWDGEKLIAKPIPLEDFYLPASGCTRSHPHENMNSMCELRTEIARLRNENERVHVENRRLIDRIETIDVPPAAPVQEPVAWMYEVNGAHTCLDLFEPPADAYDEGTLHPLYTTPPAAPVQDSTCNETLRAQGKAYPRTCRKCGLGPCIGAPKQPPAAQRQWVGLSEQELKAIWYDAETGGAMLLRFAEAIEAKLKAKNG